MIVWLVCISYGIGGFVIQSVHKTEKGADKAVEFNKEKVEKLEGDYWLVSKLQYKLEK